MASGSLIGFQEIKCHVVFDVKIDGDLTCKACLVAGGYTMETPASTTYSSVVSHESAFLIAALNDLDVFAADVGTHTLMHPVGRKSGLELGKKQ